MDELLQLAAEAGLRDARSIDPTGRQVLRIDGSVRGRRVTLARERTGDTDVAVVTTPIAPALDLGLDARPSSLARTPHARSSLGHEHLDQEYALEVDDIARARALFEGKLAERVYQLHCACISPAITDDSVLVYARWSRAVVDGVVDLVEIIEATRERIPLPPPLSAHTETWTSLATRIGVVVRRSPLSVTGAFEQLALQAVAVRASRGTHRLELALRLAHPLGASLRLSPTRSIVDSVGVLFGGQDVRVGDEAFDAAYRIRVGAGHEAALVRALDRGTRALLLGARAHGAAIYLDDLGVRALFDAAAPPDALPAAVEPLAEAVRRLERALRLGGRAASPYRA